MFFCKDRLFVRRRVRRKVRRKRPLFRPSLSLVGTVVVLFPACTMMPSENERLRVARIENAVLPMADAALEAGQLETARRLYTRLLDVDSQSVDARIGLGDVALAERAPARAANWYQAATMYAERPDRLHSALLAHGRAALTAGDLEGAQMSFARLTDPEQRASKTHVAWGFNGMGVVSLLQGKPHGAVTALERAVLAEPYEPRFQNNLTRALRIAAEYRPVGTEPESPPLVAETPVPPAAADDGTGPSSPGPAIAPPQESTAAIPFDAAPTEIPVPTSALPDDSPVQTLAESAPLPPASDAGHPDATVSPSDRVPVEAPVVEDDAPEPPFTEPPFTEPPFTEPPFTEPPFTEPPFTEPPFTESDAEIRAIAVSPTDGDNESDDQEVASLRRDGPSADIPSSPNRVIGEEVAPATPNTGEEPETPRRQPEDSPLGSSGFMVRIDDGDFLQVGAYAVHANAARLKSWLDDRIDVPVRIDAGDSLHRVRIGPIPSRSLLPDFADTLGIKITGVRAKAAVQKVHGARRDEKRKDEMREREAIARTEAKKPLLVVDEESTYLQVGAYANHDAAVALASSLRSRMDHPVVISPLQRGVGDPLYRVRVGPVSPPPPQSLLEAIAVSAFGR